MRMRVKDKSKDRKSDMLKMVVTLSSTSVVVTI
jgi:hypothetical protein